MHIKQVLKLIKMLQVLLATTAALTSFTLDIAEHVPAVADGQTHGRMLNNMDYDACDDPDDIQYGLWHCDDVNDHCDNCWDRGSGSGWAGGIGVGLAIAAVVAMALGIPLCCCACCDQVVCGIGKIPAPAAPAQGIQMPTPVVAQAAPMFDPNTGARCN